MMDKEDFILWTMLVLAVIVVAVVLAFLMIVVVNDDIQCNRFGTELAVRTEILNGDCYLELRDGYLIRQDKYLELIEGKY